MTRRIVRLALALMLAAPAALGAGRPGVLQDAPRLTWLVPGFLPGDGLLTAGLRGGTYTPGYNPTGGPAHYRVMHAEFFADWVPLPGVAVSWSQAWRSWADYQVGGQPPSGSGLADGAWRAAVAVPRLPRWLGLVGWAGSNLPVGGVEVGEGEVSPEVGATLSLSVWRASRLPELRLHASLGRRWNRNEDEGYGTGAGSQPQPWYPQYPDAASAGGTGNNDFRTWGFAVEFRRAAASLWLEYSERALTRAENVSGREDQRVLAAGLRWGLEEGWALAAEYQVGFWKDDLATEWYPRHPDLGSTLAVSRQFALGGRDHDGDGIPDRRDRCPAEPEDADGFADEDGCPDLDNDEDGIQDRIDHSPLEPEDFDGYSDEDGVPDPDNDGDGILDQHDACPDEPEDLDGHKDQDGCPEEFIDRDQDGIADEDDLCPARAEDRDGFQDHDGCPDPDNDLDGIDDLLDACPDQPEDYDGDRDGDGCPDQTPGQAGEEGQEG
ncbi:MAG TPA: thrombospondin type 3 repeat-containing protein [Candidatus Krumholzibacteria bacterium]|nr:thrombospondin type 3 repeat-containing protein [Candidatus Krumholzibacteria bacterium]HPD71081.1 thrombospondin type 3 repeat-containing protein [Candidatus Krumholzibacteria bacterium]HRY39219.1 thrombospondin type 3 repeat-containing protein [Candidatus Krumholzibacteria bacterium]